DDVIVLGKRSAAGAGGRDRGPVEAAAAPARAVELEDEWHVIEACVGNGAAVVDVADHDQLGDAVAVDIGNNRGAVAEVGTVLDAAVGVAAQVDGLVDVDTHLTPELARGEDGVHGELVAVSVEGVDVVRAGDEQLLEAVAVHVGHDDVLIPHAEAVARPAGTNDAVGLEDVELAGRHAGGLTRDDLELAVFI